MRIIFYNDPGYPLQKFQIRDIKLIFYFLDERPSGSAPVSSNPTVPSPSTSREQPEPVVPPPANQKPEDKERRSQAMAILQFLCDTPVLQAHLLELLIAKYVKILYLLQFPMSGA